MLLNILTEPNTILRQKAKDINWGTIDKTVLASLATDMLETMYVKYGVGLAAPQVGHSIRMFVISKAYSLDKTQEMVLINPVWEKASIFKVWDEEGCLSVPDIYGHVKRFKKIKVKGLDLNGKPVNFMAEGFLARIIQHESDHLDGVLFIDKAKDLHPLEKNI